MTSSGREALKWIALVLMTGDHVAKVLFGGYVPVLSELGRIAFPVFALVMAYNLAQPRADYAKSVLRLAGWGLLAQPFHAWAFGEWLPLNVLLTFALAAFLIWTVEARHWLYAAVAGLVLPLVVDYQWAGVWLVLAGWSCFRQERGLAAVFGSYSLSRDGRIQLFVPFGVWACMASLCWYNGNVWSLAALSVLALGYVWWPLPRLRWAFYGYYVGHLGLLLLIASLPAFQQHVT
ncbi:TraX family protein [Xanthomonas arboricola]|uniref:TraX family protein n=2 Tax=Xanthomonas arboricola pv. pruni TaxID=69929 RepID=A0AAP4KDM7_9XANT|nr:TraX family protein [Xanthomonas arboricola]MDN0289135.1 TraX family protein [Xanthomonas arboricola pv. pruni]MDN0293287.1 TraX family protein [Xanthomonas arboricola pv. pruni]MDN0297389.1 TraX family protein [Xanthomonas arboricola pv. pruni]MDN0301515.1 TraX family protein [Xanthomonas arboricola pv. pruni]MDN0305630.1 TraX family protein [Xanthomonas arboricola pv. pruni]